MTKTGDETPGAGLAALVARAERAGRDPAPVERWNPPFCGDIDMVIHADGHWSYMGTPIARPALVRLFASVLRRDEDGRDYLVTPVEKLGITVEDAHFLAVEMDATERDDGSLLTFRLDSGDVVAADRDHPIRFAAGEGFRPYLTVRGRLEARLTRALAIELAALLEEDGQGGLTLRSGGASFAVPESVA